jgi:transcriptional regulator with XRE-family HTH domain
MAIKKTLLIDQPEIGKLIRELRLLMGLTQEQFATELGVVYPTVNRWENSHSKPSPLAMQKIETLLQQRGNRGQELLSCYFPKQEQAQMKEQQDYGST